MIKMFSVFLFMKISRFSIFYSKRIIFAVFLLAALLISQNCFAEGGDFDFTKGYNHEEYLTYCKSDVFKQKYKEAGCWSCSVIFILMASLTGAASALATVSTNLADIILIYGAAIWLAIYFLKSVGAFAAQDPSRVLDGAFTFMFKWAIAYLAVQSGINYIVGQVVNPLLGIGLEVGTTFIGQAGG